MEDVIEWQEKCDIHILNNINDSEDSAKEKVRICKIELKPSHMV